jgi:hypothetical protein
MIQYIVLREFADKDDFAKKYKVGDKLPTNFSKERIANIVGLGLAKSMEINADNDMAIDIDLTGSAVEIIKKVKIFTDAEKLKQYLTQEKSAEVPRVTVIKAIEERIVNLVKQ